MKKIATLFLVWPSIVLADPQPASQNLPIVPPSPTGAPHACGVDWYPPAALAAGEEGKTTLAFRIGVDGGTSAISVATSSGYADLDDAAMKCVATWKYQPALRDGHPHETDWKAAVEWSMAATKTQNVVVTIGKPSANPPTQQQPIGSHVCKNPDSPPAPLGKMSVVILRILPDGSVDHVKLNRSSGDSKLDDLALACASDWKYTPLPADVNHGLTIAVVPVPW